MVKMKLLHKRKIYGLIEGEQILHTAHRTTTSHTAWERLIRILDKAKIDYTAQGHQGERIELT